MPGIDSFAKLVLHCDGADTSNTFTDSSLSPYTVTANGNAQIDTDQSKFGGASGLFDGTGDYLSVPDSLDWQLDDGSDSNTWTVDFWVRFNGDPGANEKGLVEQFVDSNNHWFIELNNNKLEIRVRSSGSNIVLIAQNWNPADATWYHIAIVKNGTTGYMHFVDGTQIGVTTVDTSTIPNFAGALNIGMSNTKMLTGWIDELRISKGIARWTADFTPPTSAYSAASTFPSKLMLMGVG